MKLTKKELNLLATLCYIAAWEAESNEVMTNYRKLGNKLVKLAHRKKGKK
jgi:hypothetical protein